MIQEGQTVQKQNLKSLHVTQTEPYFTCARIVIMWERLVLLQMH